MTQGVLFTHGTAEVHLMQKTVHNHLEYLPTISQLKLVSGTAESTAKYIQTI